MSAPPLVQSGRKKKDSSRSSESEDESSTSDDRKFNSDIHSVMSEPPDKGSSYSQASTDKHPSKKKKSQRKKDTDTSILCKPETTEDISYVMNLANSLSEESK